MIRYGITLIALAALLGIVGISPASARATSRNSDPECLWQQMKPTTRTALANAYATSGADALGSVSISNEAIRSIARSCAMRRADDASLMNVGTAIAGIALQHAAAQRLHAMGVPASRLESVWVKAPADEKGLVLANISEAAPADMDSARQFFRVMIDLAQRAGASLRAGVSPIEDKNVRPYIDWFQGYAQAEHFWAARPHG